MRSASLSKRLAAMGGHAEAQNASATIDLSSLQMQMGEATTQMMDLNSMN